MGLINVLKYHWCETSYVLSENVMSKDEVCARDQFYILPRMKKSIALFHIKKISCQYSYIASCLSSLCECMHGYSKSYQTDHTISQIFQKRVATSKGMVAMESELITKLAKLVAMASLKMCICTLYEGTAC